MPITESQAWKEAAVTVPKDEVMLVTLELHHPAFVDESNVQTAVRVVLNTVDVNLRLDGAAPLSPNEVVPFKAIAFTIEYPRTGDLGLECPIRIDNVGRELSKYLAAASQMNTPVLVIFRGYLYSDPDTVAQGPFRLELRGAKRKSGYVEGVLMVSAPNQLKFAKKVYDMISFPSLMAASEG